MANTPRCAALALGGLLALGLPRPAAAQVSFTPKTDFATGAFPTALAVADLNGHGKPDLVVANTFDGTVSVLLGTGTGRFGPKTDFAMGAYPVALAVADLNGDGKPDLVVANMDSNTVSVLLNTTVFSRSRSFAPKTDVATGGEARALAVADLNGDARQARSPDPQLRHALPGGS